MTVTMNYYVFLAIGFFFLLFIIFNYIYNYYFLCIFPSSPLSNRMSYDVL